jgi:PKD repeat protein
VPPAGPAGPTAVINATTSAKVGETVTFDGSASVTGSSPIANYEWNLGDGSKASGAIVQYAYAAAGTYNVSLTVTDQFGLSNNTSQSISITAAPTLDVPPTAAIQGPSVVGIGEQATFTAAGSTAGSATITKYIWNFGDGNTAETSESTATTIYAQAGVYQVTVTVVDANNLSDSAGTSISVNASLQGTEWLLNNTIQGTSINVLFGNGSLSGFGGCNSYSGAYTADPTASSGSMSISGISSSQKLCSEEISGQETVYLTDLGTVTSFAISGNQLTLTSAGGGLVYRGVPVASIYQ